LTHHAKQVSKDHDVALTASDGRTIVFPRGIIVYINNIALNIDQKTWGKDSKDFRPDRWLNDPSAPAGTTTLASLKTPPKGTYLPWSGGPRLCPGMKMSQVEFVSVIMIMYGFYRCEAVKVRPDETDEEVRERVEGIMKDSQPRLTLQMNRDRDLTLRFIER
jgi:cytochrome P450